MALHVLVQRALNRALLARQLLERQPIPVVDAVEHLVALQAQVPVDPYVCLWSRIDDFAADRLEPAGGAGGRAGDPAALHIHLTTGRDALAIWPLLRSVVERGFYTGSPFGRRLAGMDVAPLLALGRQFIDEKPRTRAELRPLLAAEWPDNDRDALVYALAFLEPLVQIPPRGLWGRRRGRLDAPRPGSGPREDEPAIDELVLRYLGAFGPASVRDVQEWSGLTRLEDVIERLRPTASPSATRAGASCSTCPTRPAQPDTPAPIRFLPQYDNVLLGHADRSRIIPDAVRGVTWPVVWVGEFPGRRAGQWNVASRRHRRVVAHGAEPVRPADRNAARRVGRRSRPPARIPASGSQRARSALGLTPARPRSGPREAARACRTRFAGAGCPSHTRR